MIQLVGISKKYPNGVKALTNINIHVKKGEFVFLVGPSGAGKSTFIKLLLKEENTTGGKLLINGENITKMHRRKIPYLRRKMGVVFPRF